MKITLIIFLSISVVGLCAHFVSKKKFERYVEHLMSRLQAVPAQLEQPQIDLDSLPEIVQKHFAGSVGSSDKSLHSVYLRQNAELRMGPDKPWQPILCEQAISLIRPEFVWSATQYAWRLTQLEIVDAFVDGSGVLRAQLLGSIPVAKASGPEIDKSELMRYLAEIAWAPDALLTNTNLRWKSISEYVVELSADGNAGPVSVQLQFNQNGDIVEVFAEQRGSTENGKIIQRPWRGLFSEHREMGDRRIPTYAEVGYLYDNEYKAYWRGEITDYRVD